MSELHPFTRLAEALADPQQPEATFAALDQALQDSVGHRFLSMLLYHRDEAVAERLYSSRPALFPARGRKRFADAPIQHQVATTGQPYIGRDATDLRRDFPDHEKIFALDCQSILNMPVLWQGTTLGQVNLLHEAQHYGEQHLPIVQALVQMAVPAFIVAANRKSEGAALAHTGPQS